MLEYYKFVENNKEDNQTYYFYIPMTKPHRDRIADLIESTDEFDSPYSISETSITEDEVNKYASEKRIVHKIYLPQYNKCKPLSDLFIAVMEEGGINILENDVFYRGTCWDRIK